jgi:hypothetical protein
MCQFAGLRAAKAGAIAEIACAKGSVFNHRGLRIMVSGLVQKNDISKSDLFNT